MVSLVKRFFAFSGKVYLFPWLLLILTGASSFGKALPPAVKNMSDQEYEDYIHGIYIRHYRDPTPYETWSQLISSLPERSHKLKFKDNLWDLSDSYLKDNLMWPKLWVVNAHINNPHRIQKGDSIKFDRDTLAAVNQSGHSVNPRAQFPDIKVPPHTYQKKALERWEIPPSLPTIKDKIDPPPPDTGFDLGVAETDKSALLPFYLSEEDLSGEGAVESKDGYGFSALNGEDIIISYDGEIVVEGLYTIFENRGSPVFSFASLLGLNFKGYEIAVKGIVKIIGFIEGSEGLYRARVVESPASIEPGQRVMKGVAGYTLSQKGSPGSVSGNIIGSPHREIKTFLGIYALVYLDKGLSNGIQTGDVYDVRLNKKMRAFQYPYLYDRPAVGKIRVIHANPDTATAIIIAARDTIKVGDFFEPGSGVSVMKDSKAHEEIDEPGPPADPHEEMGMEVIEEETEDGGPDPEEEPEATPPEDADDEIKPPSDSKKGETGTETAPPETPAEGMETEVAPPDEAEEEPEPETAPPPAAGGKTESGSMADEGMDRESDEFDETELNQSDLQTETKSKQRRKKTDSASPVPEEVKQEFMEVDQF